MDPSSQSKAIKELMQVSSSQISNEGSQNLSPPVNSDSWIPSEGSQNTPFGSSTTQCSMESDLSVSVNPSTLSQSHPGVLLTDVKQEPESADEDETMLSNTVEPKVEKNSQTDNEQLSGDRESSALNWKGKYGFSLKIETQDNQEFSVKKSKLYTKPSEDIYIGFICDFDSVKNEPLEIPLELKCFLQFVDSTTFQAFPVGRCEQDKHLQGTSTTDRSDPPSAIDHSLLCTHSTVKRMPDYERSPEGVLYVRTPLGKPTPGITHIFKSFQIICKNTCYEQEFRKGKSLTCVFELNEGDEVVGRSSFSVRVCSAPKRDFIGYESKGTQEGPSGKKIKKPNNLKFVLNKRKRKFVENFVQGQKKKARTETSTVVEETVRRLLATLSNLKLPSLSPENKAQLIKAAQLLHLANSSIPLVSFVGKQLKEDVEKAYAKVQAQKSKKD